MTTGSSRPHAEQIGGYLRAHADQRLSRTVTQFQARRRAERRLGALGRRFNDCPECAQIIRFCVRGGERAKTFIAGGVDGRRSGRHGRRRYWLTKASYRIDL